jgi:hypothetical protein
MTNTIHGDFFKYHLFEMLDETFTQVHGRYMDKGASLFETLATVTAEEASKPVSSQCASLAAQVEHVNFYLEVTEHYLLGKPDQEWDWRDIWSRVEKVTPDEWTASKNKLRDTYQRVRQLMDSFDDWSTGERFGGALNLLVHSAYHLGEIRQALCTLR